MKNFNNIPNHGRFDSIAALLNKNFGYAYMNFLELLYHHTKFLGLFPSEDEFGSFASENITTPEEGMYVYVGDSSPFDVITYTTFPIYQLDADGNPATGDDDNPIIIGTETRWGKTGTTDGSVTIATGSNADAVLTDEGEDEAGSFKWKGDLQAQRTVGGVNTGTKFKVGTLIEEIIRKIFYQPKVYTKGSFSVSVNKDAVEYGTDGKEVTVTISITKGDNGACSAKDVVLKRGDTVVQLKEITPGVTYQFTEDKHFTENVTYTATVSFPKGSDESQIAAFTDTKSQLVEVCWRAWYGVIGSSKMSTLTAAQMKTLKSTDLIRQPGITVSDNSLEGSRNFVVAFPEGRTLRVNSVAIDTPTNTETWDDDVWSARGKVPNVQGLNNTGSCTYVYYIRSVDAVFGKLFLNFTIR